MNGTVNGHRPTVTVRGGADVRVRAHGNPLEGSDPVGGLLRSACTRAIPHVRVIDHDDTLGDFARRHVGDAKTAAAGARFVTDVPQTIGAAARTVFPAAGEAPNRAAWVAMTTAGVLRLAGTTVGWLVVFAVATRIRAAVTTVLLVLLLLTHYVLPVVAG